MDKVVLVTGASGLIGSALCGAQATGLSASLVDPL